MERTWRYNLAHMGDNFVTMIECAIDSGRSCAENVFFGFKSRKILKQQHQTIYQVGERTLEIRKEQPDLFESDEQMTELFTSYDSLQQALDAYARNREERSRRIKEKLESCLEPRTEIVEDAPDLAAATA